MRRQLAGAVGLLALAFAASGCGGSGAATPASAGTGVADHSHHATATVNANGLGAAASTAGRGGGVTRTYYVAAEEVDWDYAPSGKNLITGEEFGEVENVFMEHGADRIGRVNVKAVYRAYTDATFTTPLPVEPRWEHLGLLGPVMHAEVGDTIQVEFLNRTSRPTSMHPHGVLYDKASEGAPYADGTSGADKADDAVPPGERHQYIWRVPPRAGPAPGDGSSVMWMYHGHTDEVADTNAGLMGPIIVTARGMARRDGTPRNVDREFIVVFSVMDENASPYLDRNIAEHTDDPASVDPDDPDFQESNLKHAMNGYVYGNLPGLEMRAGERVRWYLMGMGTEVDLHTPHWHGNVATAMGMRTDVVALLPATMAVGDMRPDNAGTWLFHCHVNDHITAGMSALYTVLPR